MWWFPLATGALSAVAADKKNRQMQANNKAQAEQTRYSTWSGMGAGQINNQYADPLTAGLGGGLQGAAFSQGFQNNMKPPGTLPTPEDAMMADQFNPMEGASASPWMSMGRNPRSMIG